MQVLQGFADRDGSRDSPGLHCGAATLHLPLCDVISVASGPLLRRPGQLALEGPG